MADTKKRGFKTVEINHDELDSQIAEHRKEVIKKTLRIIIIGIVLVLGVQLFLALRSFKSYDVISSTDRNSSEATQYAQFGKYLLEYSNDGISCVDGNKEIIWNQAFEMISPQIHICGEFLIIYDAGGTRLFIMTEAGFQKEIKTTSPIQMACVANQGTVAVLMKEDNESQVKLFDKKGNELANGKFYGEKGSFPVDIALSHDATKLAVGMLDISEGKLTTTITFYNFGSVGQSEIDNNVGSFVFEDLVIPEIEYVSNSKMIAVGTGKILIFEGAQKPELKKEVLIEQEILSCFHNDKYIGVVYDNVEEDSSWRIQVVDLYGNTIMENDITIAFDKIGFLSNNEIYVLNANACEIFTIHSIKKFSYSFDNEIAQILSQDSGQNYMFIFKDTIEEVRLK